MDIEWTRNKSFGVDSSTDERRLAREHINYTLSMRATSYGIGRIERKECSMIPWPYYVIASPSLYHGFQYSQYLRIHSIPARSKFDEHSAIPVDRTLQLSFGQFHRMRFAGNCLVSRPAATLKEL